MKLSFFEKLERPGDWDNLRIALARLVEDEKLQEDFIAHPDRTLLRMNVTLNEWEKTRLREALATLDITP